MVTYAKTLAWMGVPELAALFNDESDHEIPLGQFNPPYRS